MHFLSQRLLGIWSLLCSIDSFCHPGNLSFHSCPKVACTRLQILRAGQRPGVVCLCWNWTCRPVHTLKCPHPSVVTQRGSSEPPGACRPGALTKQAVLPAAYRPGLWGRLREGEGALAATEEQACQCSTDLAYSIQAGYYHSIFTLCSGHCSACVERAAVKILMPGMWQTFQVCGDLGAAEPGLVDTLPHLGIVCYVNATDSTRMLLSSASQPGSESGAGSGSGLPTSCTVPGLATWVSLSASCQGASAKPGFRTLSPKQ